MSKINETNYPRRPQSDYEDTDMLIIQEAGGNTYTTRIEDIREDCQEAIAPIVGAVNDALAPPENESTASQSYAIGEHFMRNGDFCTAIAAITSGASFTLNTNYVVGTIAEALESLNSDIATKDVSSEFTYSTTYLDSFIAYLSGNTLTIYGQTKNVQIANNTPFAASFPAKYKPKHFVPVTMYNTSTNKPNTGGMLWVQPNGNTLAYFGDTVTATFSFMCEYLI